MKLSDVKPAIDAFFDNISDEDLFRLLTEKYNMPICDCLDRPDKICESVVKTLGKCPYFEGDLWTISPSENSVSANNEQIVYCNSSK